MSEKLVIDARGLSCPAPVVKAKKALKDNNEFEILVDSEVAKENVTRYCQKEKATVSANDFEDGWKLSVKK